MSISSRRACGPGKAILCEKPIDLVFRPVECAEGRIAGSSFRSCSASCGASTPGHSAARQALEDGEIGDLYQVTITSRDPGMAPADYIEVSGGIFRDMTIHDLDMARFILGEEITHVTQPDRGSLIPR
jgi:myo-inositol 2-dehydrogenase/D-chiro-inositol 1-dehydrogenase